MEKLIDSIINKDFTSAEKSLKEEFAKLVQEKLKEKKKMIVAEQVVHKDGLVHLATGEKVLPSVYRQRRWLTEGADNVSPADDWHENWKDRHDDLSQRLKDDATNPARKAVEMHLKKAKEHMKKGNTDDAESHLRDAESLYRKSHGKKLEEANTKEDMMNALLRQGHTLESAKKKLEKFKGGKKKDLKEDCGLDPDKEKKVEAAREKAKLLLQPQLDTTAPRVDRTKVSIPKGVRPADRLTAPDLGPKEDEWMHGKKLDEERMSQKKKEMSIRKFMAHDPKAGESIIKQGKEQKMFDSAKKEIKKLKSKSLEEALEAIAEERKRTQKVADAFMMKRPAKERTLTTDGNEVKYHGNTIAKHEGDEVHVSAAGWGHSPSTRGHINGILSRLNSPKLHVKKGTLYHGDNPVGSKDWIKVKR